MQESILAKLEASRKELLDLGLRNPLLNYRQLKGKGLHIVQRKSEAVFDLLVNQEKALSFTGIPDQQGSEEPSEEIKQPQEDQNDTKLSTKETQTSLQNKLLNTYYTARTSLEEQGVNILFLALGMLHWRETETSPDERLAPLVLVPVRLERSSALEKFRLLYTLEDLGINVSLQEKMKTEYNISIPDVTDWEEFSFTNYVQKIEEQVQHRKNWKVSADSIVLGFFSFGKFLIYNDLENANWPDPHQPFEHPILQSLFGEGFTDLSPSVSEEAFIDSEPATHQLFQVVDADSSQTLTMLAVHEGRNLVVQGPPGTGKSQTITNIIANAVGHGKKVLFVAEKMAALEVVKRRLDNIHLGVACLELHSHKANKKELHEELRRVMYLGKPQHQKLEQDVAHLQTHREEVNAYCFAVNAEIEKSGLSMHQINGLYLQLIETIGEEPLPKLPVENISSLNASSVGFAQSFAELIQARLGEIGIPSQLCFWGSQLTVLLPQDESPIRSLIGEARKAIEAVQLASVQLAAFLKDVIPDDREESLRLISVANLAIRQPDITGVHISSKDWILQDPAIQEALSKGEQLTGLRQQYDSIFIKEAWEEPMQEIRQPILTHGHKWWRFLISEYRRANNRLAGLCKGDVPKSKQEKLQYIEAIQQAQELQSSLREKEDQLKALFGSQWKGTGSDWKALRSLAAYLKEIHQLVGRNECPASFLDYLADTPSPREAGQLQTLLSQQLQAQGRAIAALTDALRLDESASLGGRSLSHQLFNRQQEILENWLTRFQDLHKIISWNNLVATAREKGLGYLAEAATKWEGAARFLKAAFLKTWYEYLMERAMATHPALSRFERATHEQTIQEFRKKDELSLLYNRTRVALTHWENLPKGPGAGQVTVLRTEFNKRSRHLPIRRLIQEAGLAIQAIKPVFMMSPLSIANFLAPGAIEFDLVIFDEASQVKPVEALGAILRGRQLVVVGDSKQLPPTSFFDSLTKEVDDEDNVTADMQSILGLCDSKNAPERMLRWHYRSRHESLINLSNRYFYENRLVVFPSPGSRQNLGLVYHHLPQTFYDRGNTRTNRKEAEAVVEAICQHAKEQPQLTLGVVAFSTAQRQAIQDALEARIKMDPAIERYLQSHPTEPFFIKNLENVQGDERDVIFISVGYGKTEEGYLSMSFGPLNNEGGERRLNVLITRAKLRCEVFTNLQPEDIDLERTKSVGVGIFKAFLQFAKSGKVDLAMESGAPSGSPFEDFVADKLSALGFQVKKQVGSQGFYIDLAIQDPEHPGRYLLGIECDGRTYHSSRSARDRDRLRQQVLENVGWRIHRIWSTDWFKYPERELQRAVEAINKAKEMLRAEDIAATEAKATGPQQQLLPQIERQEVEQGPATGNAYQYARLPDSVVTLDFSSHPKEKLADWIRIIVDVESPVHIDEATRRLVYAGGLSRVGNRLQAQVHEAIDHAENKGMIVKKGDFLWKPDMIQPKVRVRAWPSKMVTCIPPEEMMMVIEETVRSAYKIDEEQLLDAVLRAFGFSRVTDDIRNYFNEMIQQCMERNTIRQDGSVYKIKFNAG